MNNTCSFGLVVALQLLCAAQSATSADTEPQRFELREEIVYSTAGDQQLLLDAYVPAPGKALRPGLLIVHGGAWSYGDRLQLRAYATALAELGFVCFAIDYRLAPQHKFPAQIEDCRAAVKWVRAHAAEYAVDPSRLGAVGYSAGGHLVSLLGATGEPPSPDNGNVDTRIQAVVAGGAPTDFRWFPDNGDWAAYWMGGNLRTVPEKFQAASSAAFIDKDDPPMFFYNGTQDRLVPLIWTGSCVTALQAAGVPVEWHKVEGAGHLAAARDPEALRKASEFLITNLMPQPN